jgi:hypothetical protein
MSLRMVFAFSGLRVGDTASGRSRDSTFSVSATTSTIVISVERTPFEAFIKACTKTTTVKWGNDGGREVRKETVTGTS